jgi:hypothetical protein
MFESSPPGSFPLCANPSFEPYAARQLRALVEVVSHRLSDFRPLGVVLTGSLARGEAALAAGEDRRTRWLSDIECIVVFADTAGKPGAPLGESLDQATAALKAEAKVHSLAGR